MNSTNTFSRQTDSGAGFDTDEARDYERDANDDARDAFDNPDAERQASRGSDQTIDQDAATTNDNEAADIDTATSSVEVTSHSLSRENYSESDSAFLKEMTGLVPTLRAFGRSLCANKSWADDLVQETMLKAWSGRERYQVGSNMKAWLLTILRNQYYSELRHKRFEVADPNDEHASRMSVPPEHEAASQMEMLSYALTKLSNEQREAILLVCASGLSYKQAAVICNCAVGTIKSRIARARDHLLQWLGGEGAGGNPFASAGITERQPHAVAS